MLSITCIRSIYRLSVAIMNICIRVFIMLFVFNYIVHNMLFERGRYLLSTSTVDGIWTRSNTNIYIYIYFFVIMFCPSWRFSWVSNSSKSIRFRSGNLANGLLLTNGRFKKRNQTFVPGPVLIDLYDSRHAMISV